MPVTLALVVTVGILTTQAGAPDEGAPDEATPAAPVADDGATPAPTPTDDAPPNDAANADEADAATDEEVVDDDEPKKKKKKKKGKKPKPVVIESAPGTTGPATMLYAIDAPFVLDSTAPPPTLGASLLFGGRPMSPWLGLRFLGLWRSAAGMAVGGDVALTFNREAKGNSDVGELWRRVRVEPRFVLGYSIPVARGQLVPYGVVGAHVDVGVRALKALDTGGMYPLFAMGTTAGGGALLNVGALSVRADVTFGVRTFAVETLASGAIGFAF